MGNEINVKQKRWGFDVLLVRGEILDIDGKQFLQIHDSKEFEWD